MNNIGATAKPAKLANNMGSKFDIEMIRKDFPILSGEVYGKPLVFLDSGASAQKPKVVIDCISDIYESYYANVHRGAHYLSQRSTDAYEEARATIADFMNAPSEKNIVFTSGVTESINLVAATWGRKFLGEGDEVVISEMEHHANIVPWQLLREEKGFVIKIAPVGDDGSFRLEDFQSCLSSRTKLVAVTEISNVLGSRVPVKEVARLAHEYGAKVLIDGAQGIVHQGVDVQELDIDFYGWTGHKLYGPSGVGVLYGKADVLESMPPYQGGGDMIERVSFEKTTFQEPPYRFEAGTPPIAQAIGLGTAVKYVSALGMENIAANEKEVLDYARQRLADIDGFREVGTTPDKAGIISFLIDGLHPYDVATILDRQGIATRVGKHCAEPLMDRMGLEGTVRASFGLYNNHADVDALVHGIMKARLMLT
jgi:cysteine desulfurase/selenocysteine lyase